MWMQILIAAGLKPIGEQFSDTWEETLKDANPSGFWESLFRRGINYHTNPHPESGAYLFPHQTRRHVVKVFIPGLVHSDRAYIDHVVGTLRPWREYEASLHRMFALEVQEYGRSLTQASMIPPHLHWWTENFSLIRDIAIKQYPVSLSTYDALLEDPEKVITQTLQWLGGGDARAAIAAVKPEHRTQQGAQSDSFEPEVAQFCDELYETIDRRAPLGTSFVERLNECDELLIDRVREEERKAKERMATFKEVP